MHWALLWPFLLALPALAEEEEEVESSEDEVVVVTATRQVTSLLDTPQAVGVVSEAAIRESMPTTVNDTISDVPGVETQNHGGVYYWNPVIRGLSGRRVVMLLEGDRVTSNKTMGVTGFWIDTLAVQQVEVLRGPSSVLYGTDALGGVVNVLLRDPFADPGLHGRLSAHVGHNNGEASTGLGVQWASKRLTVGVSGRLREAGDYHAGGGEEVVNSYYSDQTLAGNLGLRLGDHTLMVRHHHADQGDVGKAETEGDQEKHRLIHFPADEVERLSVAWDFEPASGWAAHASAYRHWGYRHNTVQSFTSDYATLVTRSEKEADIDGLGGTAWVSVPLHANDELLVGLQADRKWVDMQMQSFLYLPSGDYNAQEADLQFEDASRTAVAVFAQNQWSLPHRLDLHLGLRGDSILSDEGELPEEPRTQSTRAFSGNLGAAVHLGPDTRLTLNGGRAFRAPGLEEQYLVTTTCLGLMCGAPTLTPERSWNMDVGLKGRPGRWSFEAYGYSTWVEDLITARTEELSVDESCEYTYTNTAEARLLGADGRVSVRIPLGGDDLSLLPKVSAAYVHGQDTAHDEPLTQIPPLSGKAALRLRARGLPVLDSFVQVDTTLFAAQTRPGTDEVESEPYVLVNLGSGLTLDGILGFRVTHLHLRVENLLDQAYQAHLSSTRGLGRSARIGFTLEY